MTWEEAEEINHAFAKLEKSPAWAMVLARIDARIDEQTRQALIPGKDTVEHTSARERRDELILLLDHVEQLKQNALERLRTVTDENLK